jgi:hypothetical protein
MFRYLPRVVWQVDSCSRAGVTIWIYSKIEW